jgi:hypothetical protein
MYPICPGCLVIGGQKFTALDPGMTEDEFTLIHPWFFPECGTLATHSGKNQG